MNIQIKLKHFQVTDLSFNIETFDKSVTKHLETTFNFDTGFPNDDDTSFAIMFDLLIENIEKNFLLKVKSTAHFETDKPFDKNFKDSSFIKVSAPAIAFPYLRSFISHLTLDAGYDPIILPSFNFIKIAEDSNMGNSNK